MLLMVTPCLAHEIQDRLQRTAPRDSSRPENRACAFASLSSSPRSACFIVHLRVMSICQHTQFRCRLAQSVLNPVQALDTSRNVSYGVAKRKRNAAADTLMAIGFQAMRSGERATPPVCFEALAFAPSLVGMSYGARRVKANLAPDPHLPGSFPASSLAVKATESPCRSWAPYITV